MFKDATPAGPAGFERTGFNRDETAPETHAPKPARVFTMVTDLYLRQDSEAGEEG